MVLDVGGSEYKTTEIILFYFFTWYRCRCFVYCSVTTSNSGPSMKLGFCDLKNEHKFNHFLIYWKMPVCTNSVTVGCNIYYKPCEKGCVFHNVPRGTVSEEICWIPSCPELSLSGEANGKAEKNCSLSKAAANSLERKEEKRLQCSQ